MKKMYVVEDSDLKRYEYNNYGPDLVESSYFEESEFEKALKEYEYLKWHCELEPISRYTGKSVELWLAEVVEEDGCRWAENYLELIKGCKKTTREMIGFDD